MSTLKDKPLWLQRVLFVVLAPIIFLFVLFMALQDAWDEFRFSMRGTFNDMAKIWRGE